jgi:hypothetical protein
MRLLTAQVREQAAQIQKVSAQLEAGKPAPQEKNRDVSKGRVAQIGSFEKKIVQKVAMVC